MPVLFTRGVTLQGEKFSGGGIPFEKPIIVDTPWNLGGERGSFTHEVQLCVTLGGGTHSALVTF